MVQQSAAEYKKLRQLGGALLIIRNYVACTRLFASNTKYDSVVGSITSTAQLNRKTNLSGKAFSKKFFNCSETQISPGTPLDSMFDAVRTSKPKISKRSLLEPITPPTKCPRCKPMRIDRPGICSDL